MTLDNDPARRRAALDALSADPRLTLGDACGNRLPLVAETETLDEGEALFAALAVAPGVLFVDVVSVDFSDLEGDSNRGQA